VLLAAASLLVLFAAFRRVQEARVTGEHGLLVYVRDDSVQVQWLTSAATTGRLEYRLKQGREFLEDGHKVQVVCIFRGRQMAHPEHGYQVMKIVAETLADVSKIEMTPKLMGRRMTMLLAHK
jgi:translation initiation factor IF-3